MTRLVFDYAEGSYQQGMMERRKRLREEDVGLFCRYWLAGRDVTWICSQFTLLDGRPLHWNNAYAHARRMVQQGILPAQAAGGPIRRYGPNGQLLAGLPIYGKGAGFRRYGRPTRAQAAAMAGLPDQTGVVQRPGVPWQQQRAEREARERAEAGIAGDETLTAGEKAEAREAAARAHKRRAKASEDIP